MTLTAATFNRPGNWLLIGLVGLAPLRPTRAEDAISYKYQDYQEADGRIGVQVHAALIEKDLGPALSVKVTGVIDTIAGATPTGEPERTPGGGVPLATIEEERRAWTLDFTGKVRDVRLTLGAANSRESDYVSHVWSVNAAADFNRRNTTVAFGVAGTGDDVRVFFQRDWERKEIVDVFAGITQVIDARTQVTLNLTHSHAWGYLGDPYKLVEKRVEVFPGVFLRRTFNENRPDTRDKWIVLAGLNRAYPEWHGSLDASYRFYRDDYGIVTHTVNLEWYHELHPTLVLRPQVRFLNQSAADFYLPTFTGTAVAPGTVPTGRAPYYTSDYRLSALRTFNYGLKLVWTPKPEWQLDLAVEKYDMRGRDGVTAASAYPRAVICTAGLRYAF